jgi:hypothetical protein
MQIADIKSRGDTVLTTVRIRKDFSRVEQEIAGQRSSLKP